ncbi:6-hexanolactone hydrolase [Ralstonia solanacearum]|nr:6-hexanolactone hydrolase [Ralstonia solanacearum]
MSKIDKLEARLDGIGHLLADRYVTVPPYQRAYSWADEQIEELLRDLSDAMRNKESEYFLGTVVLTKHQAGHHAVIDGQQRLATISILICAIRNHFYAIGDAERADELHRDYLAKKELRGLSETPHLTLIASDNGFYESQILPKLSQTAKSRDKKSLPASNARLETALRLCTEHVNTLTKTTNNPAVVLLDWIEYLNDNAKVIVVEVNDEAAAYTIFEVLNDRGLELSVSDLLKNFIFRVAGDKVSEAQAHWSRMAGILEGSGAEEKAVKTFIRHAWASRNGVTREKDLYDKIRQHVTGKQRALAFAKELSELALVYAALDNPSDELWKEYGPSVREAVEALQILKATQIRPLLLSIAAHFDSKEVRRAMPMLVCWTVRFMVVGKLGSGPLEQGYADRAQDVSSGKITTASQLFEASKGFLSSDTEFEQAFAVAKASAQYLARFYLRVLEKQSAAAGDELVVNPNVDAVNLEHVMPQKRAPHWLDISEEQHENYVKRLGNMALVDRDLNEKIGNLAFAEKAKLLAKSKISMTCEIASASTWGPSAIDERQRQMAKLAVKVWPLKPR